MASYISFIANYVDRPIVDKTGLAGTHYEFHWDEKELREELRSGGLMPVPSIFREVEEQLGLTLKPSKESVDVVVIDQVENLSPGQLQEP